MLLLRSRLNKLQLVFIAILLIGTYTMHGQMRKIYADKDSSAIGKLSFYLPGEGYVAFSSQIGYTTDSGKTFIIKKITKSNVDYSGYAVNLTFGFNINGVKAFDKKNIIVYGDYGLEPSILTSSDGGDNFKLVYKEELNTSTATTITQMVFPQDDNTGYAITDFHIIKTTNKGVAWSIVSDDPNAFFTNLEAADNNVVSVLAENFSTNKLLKTADGGASWQRVLLPDLQNARIKCAFFITANTGFINANNGIYKTVDGGVNWKLQNNLSITPFATAKMKFFDENTGYAFQNSISKTTDGGVTWEPLARDNNDEYIPADFQFLAPSQLWIGGTHGILEMSTNNGGEPLPKAFFTLDTTGVLSTGKVALLNFSKTGYVYKWIVNNAVVATSYNATYQHDVAIAFDTIKLVVYKGAATDTLTRLQRFYVPSIPVINSFSPVIGSTGTLVTILGANLDNVIGVSFGGVPAASFTASPNTIRAIVANGASGTITLTCLFGTFSVDGFKYSPPPTAAAPVISSIVPSSGPVGTLVTISGSNFDPVAAKNNIQFGATKATVLSASATSLTCRVPVGASFRSVAVLNKTSGLSGWSAAAFKVTFADSSNITANSFGEPFQLPYDSASSVADIIGCDLDNDGKPDAIGHVHMAGGQPAIYAWRNTSTVGKLSFAGFQNVTKGAGDGLLEITAGDIDGDGNADIVTASNSYSIFAFRNISTPGKIAFEDGISFPAANGSQNVVLEDLDNDGRPDFVVSGYNESRVAFLRNTSVPGTISFTANTEMPTGYNTNVVRVSDLDGDGKKDILCLGSGALFYFKNQSTKGNISFGAKTDIAAPGGSQFMLFDYDGDEKPDVVLVNFQTGQVMRNTSVPGTISFAPAVTFTGPSVAQAPGFENLSGDTLPDVICGDFAQGNLYAFQNRSTKGAPVIAKSVTLKYGLNAYFTSSADFDLDGKNDIAAADYKSAYIFKNKVGVPVEVQACYGGISQMDADLIGSTYQWQRYNGSAFINIGNNDTTSGVTTSQLTVKNARPYMDGNKYRCLVDGIPSCTFLLKANWSDNASIYITSSVDSACAGSPITFTAHISGLGSDPGLFWIVNNGSPAMDTTAFTASWLRDKDKVYLQASNSKACNNFGFTSNTITIKIGGYAPSVYVITDKTPTCKGDSAIFSTESYNTGAHPSYQWLVNGVNAGKDSSSFVTMQLQNNDEVKVILTPKNPGCNNQDPVTSGGVIVTKIGDRTTLPAISITPSSDSVCAGTVVTFNPTPYNAQLNPAYYWLLNNVKVSNSGILSSDQFKNNDHIQVVMKSSNACLLVDSVASNVYTMTVKSNVTPSVTINTLNQQICKGDNVLFTAAPVNGGSKPVFQWQINDNPFTSNDTTFATADLLNGDKVKVVLVSSATCAQPQRAESGIITMQVKTPATASLLISGNAVVTKGSFSNLTAVVTNGGTTSTYQWQDSTVNHSWKDIINAGEPSVTYTPQKTGDKIRCIYGGAGECAGIPLSATSNTITFVVNEIETRDSSGTIRLYPNPVTNTLHIDGLDVADEWTTLEIRSISGNLVILKQNISRTTSVAIPVDQLETGVYVAIIRKQNGETKFMKFMKVKQ